MQSEWVLQDGPHKIKKVIHDLNEKSLNEESMSDQNLSENSKVECDELFD